MASGQRSTWPIVLLLGFAVSMLIGSAVAVADTGEGGRPWWREGEPQRITGTVIAVDAETGSITLDSLLAYETHQPGVGTLTVEVPELEGLAVDETVDVVLTRHDGRWTADEVVVLDTD